MGDVFAALQRRAGQAEAIAITPASTEAPAQLVTQVDHSDLLAHAPRQGVAGLRCEPPASALEQYRAIRYQILSRAHERRLQTHLIASAQPREGRTLTALHLALAFSELRNGRALLIEADLRRPALAQHFDRPLMPGLFGYLRGEVEDIDQAIHRTRHPGLHVMPAGVRGCKDASQFLSSPRLAAALERGKDLYDHVIIDVPALGHVVDALLIAPSCDQALLVARLQHSATPQVQQARQQLEQVGCPVAGVILTHREG